MATLDDVVSLVITLASSAPTKAGFGRPLLVGYHTHFPVGVLTRLYNNADDMLTDGFTSSDALYKMAVLIKAQSPAPKDFKIGKLTAAPTQLIELTPSTPAAGEVYSGKINGLAFTFTADGTPTLAEATLGLTNAITALAGVTAADTTGVKTTVTTDVAGAVLQYTELSSNLTVKDVTAQPSTAIETQLANIYTYDADWYGLLMVNGGETLINAAALWVETKRRLAAFDTADSIVVDTPTTSTTDIGSDLHGFDYFRSGVWYHQDVLSGLAVAIMAQRLTSTAGSDTWAHKAVKGVSRTTLNATQSAAAKAKKVNVYVTLAGNGDTLWGTVASGEYYDQVRGIDALYARIQEYVIGALQANEKIPFTKIGIEIMRGGIEGVMRKFSKPPINFLTNDETLYVTAPELADIDAADKAARLLPDIFGHAVLQGAVHMVGIGIKLEV